MHVADGRMGYIGMVRAEAPFIIGRRPVFAIGRWKTGATACCGDTAAE